MNGNGSAGALHVLRLVREHVPLRIASSWWSAKGSSRGWWRSIKVEINQEVARLGGSAIETESVSSLHPNTNPGRDREVPPELATVAVDSCCCTGLQERADSSPTRIRTRRSR